MKISLQDQSVITDTETFLAPLDSPEVHDIISTSGDTGRKYTIYRLFGYIYSLLP